MYEAITSSIHVRVTPRFLEDESTPDEGRYFWAYTVEITNNGTETVQLKTRRWLITDANGRQETVRGPGVVGKTPTLAAGQSFTYTSGCPLTTPSGIMSGSYQMERSDGRMLDVTIPSFSLDSPYAKRIIN
jgi:ApaG protein